MIEIKAGIDLDQHMIQRCTNPKNERWDRYGARGIHVLCKCACGQEATVRLGHLRSGHSTTCGRCGIEHNGVRKTISEWASLYGLKESTLRARLKTLSIGEALKTS